MPTTMKASGNRSQAVAKQAELAKTIGGRLRVLRKTQRVTLVELAKSSGVDTATISRIETGRMTGTLECHMKLARGLGVKLTELYTGIEEAQAKGAVAVQNPSRRTEVYVHQAGQSSIAMLTTEVLTKKLMPVLITIEPGGSTQKEETRVGTEKFIYMLEGKLEAKVGEETHLLKRGSTLYLEASIPHLLRNVGTHVARCLAVTTPPAL
ncbi:MAG: helix-turn-helix transcriptional regulator [Candidatus Omnitrophica bacterium]|nr:helix-turn-helix transcriptional regulator [Candidatus Omnitrophota bacterium]